MGTGEGTHTIQGHLHPGVACPLCGLLCARPTHPAAHAVAHPPQLSALCLELGAALRSPTL